MLAAALLLVAGAGAAHAQAGDAPVSTSSGAGWVDEDSKASAPAIVQTAPAQPAAPAAGPLAALDDVPRDRILKGVHGSAGVVIGSHDTRGAYATVNGPLGDNARFSLGFSTLHSDAMPYGYGYPYGYGAGTRSTFGASYTWRPGADRPPFAYDPYMADWPGYPPPSREVTTDVTDAPGR
jgi:hypothetical protein